MVHPLKSHARRKLIAHVRATQPCCHLCGLLIDLDADHQREPLGSALDELVPRAHGGSCTDPANVRHAHRLCNSIRGTKTITADLRRRCRAAVVEVLQPSVVRRGW